VDEPTAGLDPGERNRFYNPFSEIGENVIVIRCAKRQISADIALSAED
jgi:energy-coupling factor transporter ATP-binding protein EcfA2